MNLTRPKRIAIELLGPPFVGVLPFLLVSLGSALWEAFGKKGNRETVLADLQLAATLMMFAYVFVGIQSILYTAIMEWRFLRGLDPCGWRSVRLSSLLGFSSGALVAFAYGFDRSNAFSLWLFWGGLGLAVGFVMGLLIKVWSAEKSTTGDSHS
jgi:hypothetical protein